MILHIYNYVLVKYRLHKIYDMKNNIYIYKIRLYVLLYTRLVNLY